MSTLEPRDSKAGSALRTIDPLVGVTLDQYAGVLACESEGIALEDALLREGVDERAWADGVAAWNKRIAAAALRDDPLLDELDERLAAARARLARRVPPLDEDVGAWFDFLRHWSQSDDPTSFLATLKLTTNDVVRLQALWGERLAKDEALRARASEAAAHEGGALPSVTPEPFALPPRPERVAAEPAAPVEIEAPPPPPLFGARPRETVVLSAEDMQRMAPPPGFLAVIDAAAHAAPPPSRTFETADLVETGPAQPSPFAQDALPFRHVPPPPETRRAMVAPPPNLPDDDETTRTGVEIVPTNALPFAPASTRERPASEPRPPPRESLPPPASRPQSAVVDFPLDRYARLCAELATYPDRTEQIFANYGLSHPRARAAVDGLWRARLADSASDYEQYARLFWQVKSSLVP